MKASHIVGLVVLAFLVILGLTWIAQVKGTPFPRQLVSLGLYCI